MRWSNLEFVLAVAREGSAAAAARVLNVNHTTVIRRVRALEDTLAEPIFEHRKAGYRLTKKGETFLEAAQGIETILADLDRKVAGGEDQLRGNVRITTTDSVFPALVPDIAALRRAHPEVTIDVSITNQRLDLFKRDADIAVRPSNQPPADLVGRRVGRFLFGLYASPALLSEGASDKLEKHPWLGMEEPLLSSVPGQWMTRSVPDSAIVLRADSFVSLRQLAEADLGWALLPCHLGDASPRLRRVFRDRVNLSVDLWLLSHRDILRARRVRVCADLLFETLRARASMFEGSNPLRAVD